jgi:hypothetical protein
VDITPEGYAVALEHIVDNLRSVCVFVCVGGVVWVGGCGCVISQLLTTYGIVSMDSVNSSSIKLF